MLDKRRFNVLNSIAVPSGAPLRCDVEELLSAQAVGQIDARGHLTDAGYAALEPYRVENAIILAAGPATRFAPLSFQRPKAMFEVRGEVLIERQIRQLKEAGVEHVTVVVGYMKESFFYLKDKPVIEIIINADYVTRNNHASLNMDEDVAPDDWFERGVLVVPVHTRGFTNCNLFFEKVCADDTGHVHGFKNFDKFKKFAEVSDVVNERIPGRESDDERILAYNIGLSIHDLAFASKIDGMIDKDSCADIDLMQPKEKFWI